MSEMNHPIVDKKKLIIAVLASIVVSGIIFIVAILPAEFGIDPMGTGQAMGFSQLYMPMDSIVTKESKVPVPSQPLVKLEELGSGSDVTKPLEALNPAPDTQFEAREDTIEILVLANRGIEYKVNMLKYGSMKYEWKTTQGEVLYLDFHGEVKQSNPPKEVFYESYTLANSHNMAGTFLAPFEGVHGWYFRNRGAADVTVRLKLSGQYTLKK